MPPTITGEYPHDWTSIACAVKSSAHWRCVRCGHDHDPPAGYTLTVHHFDGDKANCARWNLMALCQRCHLSVQARVNPEIGLLFDPAPWAAPYIAGYYAAGHGTPSPLYDLDRWIVGYERQRGRWPAWAPPPGSG